MNVTRMLVTTLLLGAIISGFAVPLPMQTVSGIVTSFSTTTSTYYSYRSETSFSTSYATSVVITQGVYTQTGRDGPYLRIRGTVGFYMSAVRLDLDLTNLMNAPIVKGVLLLTESRGGYGDNTLMRDLGSLGPGQTLTIHETLYVNPYPNVVDVRFEGVTVDLGQQIYTTSSLIAVYAYTRVMTETYLSVFTTGYAMAEPLLINTIGLIVLVALVAILAIETVLVLRRRRSTKPSSPTHMLLSEPVSPSAPSPPTDETEKTKQIVPEPTPVFCVYCGSQIPEFAKFCRKCGKPQER